MEIIKNFEKIASKLGRNKHLLSLRDGIVLSLPLILAGSIFIIITNIPVAGWEEIMVESGVGAWFGKITDASFGIMALVSVFGIAKSLSDKYKIDGTAPGILALSSYLVLIPFLVGDSGRGIAYSYLGSKGLFVAILVGMITAEIFRVFIQKNIVIKMPSGVPQAVSRSFSALIPGTVILLFWAFVGLIVKLVGFESIFEMIVKFISEPLTLISTGIVGTVIAVIFNSLFWLVGIHGGIVGAIMNPIWLTSSDQNRLAFEQGLELPHIVTSTFMDSLVWMGGGGATIGLAIVLFLFAKSKQNKVLGKLSIAPGLFNINEPLLFGLPVVMNLKMIIPFVLAPVVTTIVTYYATYFGLVARTTGVIIPWATPPIISGYLVTGGKISGAVIQIITILLTIIIYYPFFKSIDKEILKLEEKDS